MAARRIEVNVQLSSDSDTANGNRAGTPYGMPDGGIAESAAPHIDPGPSSSPAVKPPACTPHAEDPAPTDRMELP